MTVSGVYAWSGGTQSGTGSTILASGVQMNITNAVTAGRAIDDTASGAAINWNSASLSGTLNNPGQLNINTSSSYVSLYGTLNNTGTITWAAGAYPFYFYAGTLNNESGGTVNSQADQTFAVGSGTPQFNNAGTLEKTGGTGTTSLAVPFSNSGTVRAASGTLNLGSAFSNFSGTTLTGGTYIVSSTLSFTGANIQTNAATIVLDGSASNTLNSSNSANALTNFSTNAAGGSFTIQNGRNFTTTGAFTNAGNLAVGASSIFTATGNYTQTAGDTDLQGGTLAATGLVDLQGGLLSGSGAVSGNVSNQVQVGPGDSAGAISVTGNFTQTSAGTLNIELGGTSIGQFDTLFVTGTATLDGSLNVSLIDAFVPTPPDSFQVLIFGARSGDFATETGLELGGGLTLNPSYDFEQLDPHDSSGANHDDCRLVRVSVSLRSGRDLHRHRRALRAGTARPHRNRRVLRRCRRAGHRHADERRHRLIRDFVACRGDPFHHGPVPGRHRLHGQYLDRPLAGCESSRYDDGPRPES